MTLRIDILTLFPAFFDSPLHESLLGRAIREELVDVTVSDIRDHAHDRHRQVDDASFGGGPGMVMKPEPVVDAVESLGPGDKRVVLLTPSGRPFDQSLAASLAASPWIVMVCGRYEGVDERVVPILQAEEVSVGDVVLSGGEAAALTIVDAVVRLVPGVVGNEESLAVESFDRGLLDHPHYTRPRSYRGLEVPEVLLSGDHARIAAWRREAALEKTRRNRPDLLPPPDPREP